MSIKHNNILHEKIKTKKEKPYCEPELEAFPCLTLNQHETNYIRPITFDSNSVIKFLDYIKSYTTFHGKIGYLLPLGHLRNGSHISPSPSRFSESH